MQKKYVIITAGGIGTRMKANLPKQFLLLDGKPVLMRTIEAFFNYDPQLAIIITLPADYREYWQTLQQEYHFAVPHTVVAGGATRFESVKNALSVISAGDALVGVHDAVRPLITSTFINDLYEAAETYGNAVPAIVPVETVRLIENNTSTLYDRNKVRLIQTPQVFKVNQLKEAYAQPYQDRFTDDASVVEAMGNTIHLTEGLKENIKITTTSDLEYVRHYWTQRNS